MFSVSTAHMWQYKKHTHTQTRFSLAHCKPVYLHSDPLVVLFSEAYQAHAVVNKVFQTALKVPV